MCDSDSRDYNRTVRNIPQCVFAEKIPLTDLSEVFGLLKQAQSVLRQGNPERKDAILRDLLFQAADKVDGFGMGFPSAANR